MSKVVIVMPDAFGRHVVLRGLDLHDVLILARSVSPLDGFLLERKVAHNAV
jgi:hypothetical protein